MAVLASMIARAAGAKGIQPADFLLRPLEVTAPDESALLERVKAALRPVEVKPEEATGPVRGPAQD